MKEALGHLGFDSGPAVSDGNTDARVVIFRAGDLQLLAFEVRHGFEGIAYQIQDDLLDLDWIDKNLIAACIDSRVERYARAITVHQRQS